MIETKPEEVSQHLGRQKKHGEPHLEHECDFIVLGRAGDVRTAWDRRVPAEVEVARTQFHEMRRKGYRAYEVTHRGQPGEEITEFDPAAEEIIFTLPMAGGVA